MPEIDSLTDRWMVVALASLVVVLTPSYTGRDAHDLPGASPGKPQLSSCSGQK